MTFRHWLSRPRPEHLPFGFGVCLVFYSFLHEGTLPLVYQLLGTLALITAFTLARISSDIRRELRRLGQPRGEPRSPTDED